MKPLTVEHYCLSAKACALLAAVEAGLCPRVEGGWDTDAFERFWEIYQDKLSKQGRKESDDSGEVLHEKTQNKRDKRHDRRYYRDLVLKSLLAFVLGLFFAYAFKL